MKPGKAHKLDGWDVLAVGGAALIGYGVWQIYVPAAFVVLGILLMALGVRGSIARAADAGTGPAAGEGS